MTMRELSTNEVSGVSGGSDLWQGHAQPNTAPTYIPPGSNNLPGTGDWVPGQQHSNPAIGPWSVGDNGEWYGDYDSLITIIGQAAANSGYSVSGVTTVTTVTSSISVDPVTVRFGIDTPFGFWTLWGETYGGGE